MTFRQFIIRLADRMGQHQLPVVNDAYEIHHFLRQDAVHHELITRIVRQIYQASHCGYLDAPLDAAQTLSILAAAKLEMLAMSDTDICRFRFIDQLFEESQAILGDDQEQLAPEAHSIGLQVQG